MEPGRVEFVNINTILRCRHVLVQLFTISYTVIQFKNSSTGQHNINNTSTKIKNIESQNQRHTKSDKKNDNDTDLKQNDVMNNYNDMN